MYICHRRGCRGRHRSPLSMIYRVVYTCIQPRTTMYVHDNRSRGIIYVSEQVFETRIRGRWSKKNLSSQLRDIIFQR